MMLPERPDLPAAKSALRAAAADLRRRARRALGAEEGGRRLALLAERLAGPWPPGTVVAGYWPMGDEIDPVPLMTRLAALGFALALPAVAGHGRPLIFRRWRPGGDLAPGLHGTNHPPETAEPVVPRVVLVPLLAFDRWGRRLGYGGGYYDRTLEGLRADAQVDAIGLAFSAQQVPLVPHDGHDQHLDRVATEMGLMDMETP
ncbi:MAG: 5-formyltetrahydrofolate cyclo-ligase [Magnetospirillum sp.]|nr:5-formyltetrahydrofolate cyclo-ligase [Magnetospirillum sp.]